MLGDIFKQELQECIEDGSTCRSFMRNVESKVRSCCKDIINKGKLWFELHTLVTLYSKVHELALTNVVVS